jgi:FixJ family two-component response regulator
MGNPVPVIAIVDDEAGVGKALARLLRSFGFAAEAFTSGQQFFDWLGASVPDCVLLDIQMPVMSGFDIQQCLAREHPTVPCIFITASTDPADALRAAERHCELMRKPLDEDQLVAAIRRSATR